LSVKVRTLYLSICSVWYPDPQDSLVFGRPDPDLLVKGPDPSLFS
jgi:hypothetical protein